MIGRLLSLSLLFVVLVVAAAWFGNDRFIRRRAAKPENHPAASDLPYEAVAFPARDGLAIHAWFLPVDAAETRGTVILLHGHSGILESDIEIAAALRGAGYNILQLELRGYGESEGEFITFGAHECLDVLGALDFLASRGIHRVGVLGFSMGGAVAIRTAAESEAIRAVVTEGLYRQLESVMAAWARDRNLPLAGPLHTLAALSLRLANRRLGLDLTQSDPIRWVGRIAPRPILFIQGGRDPFVPMADFEALWRAAGEPKERWLVPEAGHRRADRMCPQEYHRRVIDFFDRWLAGQGE